MSRGRALYMGWLVSIRSLGEDRGDEDGTDLLDESEPPIPPGFANPWPLLRSVAKFLGVGDALIEVASARPPRRALRD